MSEARQRVLSPPLRLLLGVVGVAAVVAGTAVMVTAFRLAGARARFVARVVPAACGLVVLGGLSLLRGAVRGRIAVRPTRGPRRVR